MKLTTVRIDLAKNVVQVHGSDEHRKELVKKQLRRDQMATFFVNPKLNEAEKMQKMGEVMKRGSKLELLLRAAG